MLRRIATTKRLLSKHSHRDNNFIHTFTTTIRSVLTDESSESESSSSSSSPARDKFFSPRRGFKNESASASEHKQRIVLYTSTHEKLTISRKSEEEENGSIVVNVKVALSAHGFDKIGDVQEILKRMKEEKLIGMSGGDELIKNEEIIARMKWTGFHRTAADELYHSLWSNVNGVRDLKLPFEVRNVRFCEDVVENAYQKCVPGKTIFSCEARASGIENCLDLMDEEKYEHFCDAELDDEERAGFSSYP